jgi:hypothetical protein
MTGLELLEQEIYEQNLTIITADFSDLPLKAVYCDGVIGVSCHIKSTAEKRCILDEEYCHHLYNYGNVLNNAKQEIYARNKSYERLVPLLALKKAEKEGLHELHEIAEYLEVTKEVLQNAIGYYQSKGKL